MASSWLNFFEQKKNEKKTQKNWASYIPVSWQTNMRAKNEYIVCVGRDDDGTPRWLKGMQLAECFRVVFPVFFVQNKWASWARNKALSQLHLQQIKLLII